MIRRARCQNGDPEQDVHRFNQPDPFGKRRQNNEQDGCNIIEKAGRSQTDGPRAAPLRTKIGGAVGASLEGLHRWVPCCMSRLECSGRAAR